MNQSLNEFFKDGAKMEEVIELIGSDWRKIASFLNLDSNTIVLNRLNANEGTNIDKARKLVEYLGQQKTILLKDLLLAAARSDCINLIQYINKNTDRHFPNMGKMHQEQVVNQTVVTIQNSLQNSPIPLQNSPIRLDASKEQQPKLLQNSPQLIRLQNNPIRLDASKEQPKKQKEDVRWTGPEQQLLLKKIDNWKFYADLMDIPPEMIYDNVMGGRCAPPSDHTYEFLDRIRQKTRRGREFLTLVKEHTKNAYPALLPLFAKYDI